MLHKTKDVILPATFSLLRSLQEDEELADFFLVGGTALALQIGHRFSIDLDLFSLSPFDTQKLVDHLYSSYEFVLTSVEKNTVLGVIDDVKVDLITHAYQLVRSLIRKNDLRIASIEDIAAMKLNAIAHSGQRLKDFIDVYFILEKYPLNALLAAYEKKYPRSNIIIPIKGLTYFDEIDPQIDPPIMKKKLELSSIKDRLYQAVENPNKIF